MSCPLGTSRCLSSARSGCGRGCRRSLHPRGWRAAPHAPGQGTAPSRARRPCLEQDSMEDHRCVCVLQCNAAFIELRVVFEESLRRSQLAVANGKSHSLNCGGLGYKACVMEVRRSTCRFTQTHTTHDTHLWEGHRFHSRPVQREVYLLTGHDVQHVAHAHRPHPPATTKRQLGLIFHRARCAARCACAQTAPPCNNKKAIRTSFSQGTMRSTLCMRTDRTPLPQ
eukprot:1158074-Pelagomonas_calceolata.AAC.10